MSGDNPHLHPSARPLADQDQAARIRRIRTERWIGYARAEAALTAIEDLLTFPKRTRMPNLLLVGPTNNGKTMIVEKFKRAPPVIEAADADGGVAMVPVVKVQMPAGPDESRLFGAILDALGMPFSPRDRIAVKQDAAVRVMRATGARLLVIDELQQSALGHQRPAAPTAQLAALARQRTADPARWGQDRRSAAGDPQ